MKDKTIVVEQLSEGKPDGRYKKDDAEVMKQLPVFPGKQLVRPPGFIIYVDNNCFISPITCEKIKVAFEEQGLGDNACILSQGILQYAYPLTSKADDTNWWPLIYIEASAIVPLEFSDRLTALVIKLLDKS